MKLEINNIAMERDIEKLIIFIEANIYYLKYEKCKNAVGLWVEKYNRELALYEGVRISLLKEKFNREPSQTEIDTFLFDETKKIF
jgi:hypothetical protein